MVIDVFRIVTVGVVDENADREQRSPAERHDVEGLAISESMMMAPRGTAKRKIEDGDK